MRAFVIVLMLFVATAGANTGFRLITGNDAVNLRDLVNLANPVNLPNPFQSGSDTAVSPTPEPRLGPSPEASAPEPTPAPTATPTHTRDAAKQFEPFWVQNFVETDLWSGVDSNAVSFGRVPQWSYFQVVAPQEGTRLYVLNPLTQNNAYIDASAVGPSSAPSEGYGTAPGGTAMVVGNTDGMGVYVRRTPDMGDKVRAWSDGTPMHVLERGIQGNGRSWAKVRSPDGAEGYVPEEYLVNP